MRDGWTIQIYATKQIWDEREWKSEIYIYIQCFDKVTAIQPINGIKESREEKRIGNRRHDTNKIW